MEEGTAEEGLWALPWCEREWLLLSPAAQTHRET